jgi:hypothetical protein
MYVIAATAIPIVLCILIFVSPIDRARFDQRKVVTLLAKARLEHNGADQAVVLGDGTALRPEKEQVLFGYALTARLESSGFTVAAEPAEFGKTGLLSYFRDQAGVIRFETGERRASAASKPLAGGLAPGRAR